MLYCGFYYEGNAMCLCMRGSPSCAVVDDFKPTSSTNHHHRKNRGSRLHRSKRTPLRRSAGLPAFLQKKIWDLWLRCQHQVESLVICHFLVIFVIFSSLLWEVSFRKKRTGQGSSITSAQVKVES